MKVDMQNFQPLSMFNHFLKGDVKTNNVDTSHADKNHIDNNHVATRVVNNKLNDALGVPAKAATNDANIFDLESVAENILGFVTNAISHAQENGASEDKLKQMLVDAKKGIKEGLADASKELTNSGLMNAEIKEGIKETKDLLKQGLSTFADQLFTDKVDRPGAMSSYKEASHYSLSKDASFSFKTKEGDEVNITFNSDYMQQSASVLKQSANSMEFASSQKMSFQGAFSFEVNGELNEDEQQAINDLMASLQGVSDLFFEGNIDEAFEEAKGISMDPTHLAAFSMDLQRTETLATIKEYQQVMPGKEIATQLTPLNDQLAEAYQHAKPFAIEEHLTDLLSWLVPEEKEASDLLQYSKTVFAQLAKLDALNPLNDNL